MSHIFGNGQALEPQYKRIFKKRMKATGMSELLRKIDGPLHSTTYDRTDFVNRVLTRQGDAERFSLGLKEAHASIEKLKRGFKDWTDAEDDFLTRLLNDLEFEQRFWAAKVLNWGK